MAKLHPSTWQQEVEQLQENEALRTGDWSQLRLVRFANGQFDFSAGPVQYIAEYFAQMFESGDGKYFNNMEIEFDHAKAGPMVLSAQRREGKTPVQQRKEAEAEAKALRARVEALEAENEGLRNHLVAERTANGHEKRMRQELIKTNEAGLKTILRMEAALGKIVTLCHTYPGIADGAGEIARAALQQEGE